MVDRKGTFKARIQEFAVGQSSGGFPQLIMRLLHTEFYDDQTDPQKPVWVAWESFGIEQTGYFMLAGKNGKSGQLEASKSCEQAMSVFGWDGKSFAGLNELQPVGMEIQVRYDDDTYEKRKGDFKAQWFDKADAIPMSGIRAASPDQLRALDAQYAAMLQGNAKPAAAVSAPVAAKPPMAPPAVKTAPAPAGKQQVIVPPTVGQVTVTAPVVTPVVSGIQETVAYASVPAPVAPAAPAAPKKRGPKPKTETSKQEVLTEETAYTACVNYPLKDQSITQETLDEIWLNALPADKTNEQMDGDDWRAVKDAVIEKISQF